LNIFDIINVGLFAAAIRMATPVALAALGGVFSERVGVVNVGLEGMMLMGAFSGVYVSYVTLNPWLGVFSAIIVGGFLGLIHAFLSVTLRGDQIVSGTGLNILALGFTAYASEVIWGSRGASANVTSIGIITLPIIGDIPIIGVIIGSASPLVYLMIIIIILTQILLFKTPIGLRLRAVGEHPAAADTAGVNVIKMKYAGIIISGMLAGLGGVFLSLGNLGLFSYGMTGGRGFIALAAMIFGGWTPLGAFGASLLFGFADSLQMRLQSLGILPPQIILMLPYVITVIVLAGIVRKTRSPSDYKPYEKD
jgi:general nucleoside transport system permease protein